MNEDIWIKGYVYSVEALQEADQQFRGRILIKAHRYTGRTFDPPLVLETPSVFKKQHAAEVEGRALARELIDTGEVGMLINAKIAGTEICPTQPFSNLTTRIDTVWRRLATARSNTHGDT